MHLGYNKRNDIPFFRNTDYSNDYLYDVNVIDSLILNVVKTLRKMLIFWSACWCCSSGIEPFLKMSGLTYIYFFNY